MADQVPKGYSWIRDIAPGVSYNDSTQEISMPDGTTIPNSMFTMVNDRAYVDPSAFSSFLGTAGYQPLRSVDPKVSWDSATNKVISSSGAEVPSNMYASLNGVSYVKPTDYLNFNTPPVKANEPMKTGEPPLNTVPIRDIIPNVTWNPQNGGITLPNGQILDPSAYTLGPDGKAYVNPNAMASYFQPKAITPQSLQGFTDVAKQAFDPTMNVGYDRLNNLITFINSKLKANVQGYTAAGDRATHLLQDKQSEDAFTLQKRAMANGTYDSGVSNYNQRKLDETYAPEYTDLAAGVAASVAGASAESQKALADVALSGKDLEANYSQQIFAQAIQLANAEAARDQQVFTNMMSIAGANDARTIAMAQSRVEKAIARTNAVGYVSNEADASALGVPVGTPSDLAGQKAADRKSQLEQLTLQLDAQKKMNDADNATSRGNANISASAQKAAAAAGAGSVEASRLFNQALAIWEQTGVAPASGPLQASGVAVGTPWNKTSAQQLQDQQVQDAKDKASAEKSLAGEVAGWTNRYGLDTTTGTQAVFLTDGTDYNGAITRLNANQATLKSQGVDVDNLRRAIIDYYK